MNTFGDTESAVKIVGDDRDIVEGTGPETSTVTFNPGQTKTVTINVYGQGTNSAYKLHITRSNPELGTLQDVTNDATPTFAISWISMPMMTHITTT